MSRFWKMNDLVKCAQIEAEMNADDSRWKKRITILVFFRIVRREIHMEEGILKLLWATDASQGTRDKMGNLAVPCTLSPKSAARSDRRLGEHVCFHSLLLRHQKLARAAQS